LIFWSNRYPNIEPYTFYAYINDIIASYMKALLSHLITTTCRQKTKHTTCKPSYNDSTIGWTSRYKMHY